MTKDIYLDNNATTPIAPEVLDAMMPYLTDAFGNPSSAHRKGIEAGRAIGASRAAMARIMGVDEKEVFFTACGSEGNNIAIRGVARALRRQGSHIITSQVEHPAVLETCRDLESEGFRVTYLPVDTAGHLATEELLAEVTPETLLVTLMHVNNETGVVFPIQEIAQKVKMKNPRTIVHSDGVQVVGKVHMDLAYIDLYTLSGHKFHAPKGVGALVIRPGLRLKALMTGGGQESGLRPGTENVAGIVGMARALELAYSAFDQRQQHFRALRDRFLDGIQDIPSVQVNSPQDAVPTTLSVAFPGAPAGVLLNALDTEGIYVSAGSACASAHKSHHRRSHVLLAMGLDPALIDSTLRISFSRYTSFEDIDRTAACLRKIVPQVHGVAHRTGT